MEFDEYEYLEKTVDAGGGEERNGSSKKSRNRDGEPEKSDRSYRKRDGDDEDDNEVFGVGDGDDVRKHKRSRAVVVDDKDRDHRRSSRDRERDRDRKESRRERDSEKEVERDRKEVRRERDGEKDLERERYRERERGSREKDREKERGKERGREREKDRGRETEKERDGERDKKERDGERDKRENDGERYKRERDGERDKRERDGERDKRERDVERNKREREKDRGGEIEKVRDGERDKRDREKDLERRREREKEKEESSRRSRSRSMSRRHEIDLDREREMREREREFEPRESRRLKEKKELMEPEVDPERDQRTVFAYQMPLKANERDVYEFFSKAGKVRDVRLIMDRNSRRSKGVGYIEFYDAMSVPMAIAMSGHLLHGQPVMVKPSEAEKNLVQPNPSGGGTGGVTGPYGPVDRKLYVGNLHFNMTELQLRQIFEPFGAVELVQLPLDLETGHCKGFGFVQFTQVEHAKAAQSLNGKLEIAGRVIKVSSVSDHVAAQDTGTKSADFDDDDGGGLALNAHSRALLMQKLDRSGIALSITGSLGNPIVNGTAASQLAVSMSSNGQVMIPGSAIPAQIFPTPAAEPVGNPSECLLLKNMFDPASEAEPDFDMDIKEEVEEECSSFGRVLHIYVDRNSAGFVYLRFETVDAALKAQKAMHLRWYARRLISALFMQPQEYEAKFKSGS